VAPSLSLLLTAGAVLAVGCAPADALADSLSDARAATPPGTIVEGFELATSPAGGRVALVYGATAGANSEQRLLFARLGLGRNLGPARRLEDRNAGSRPVTTFGSQVAVSPDGGAVAAWVARGREAGRDQLRVAIAPRGHGFGPAQTLARARGRRGYVPTISVTGVAAGAHGRAVVAWSDGPSPVATLRAAVRTGPRGFGDPQRLGPILRSYASDASFVLSPRGTVVGAWAVGGPDVGDAAVAAATLRPGASRFVTRLLSRSAGVGDVSAFGGPGGAGVGWSDDPRRGNGGPVGLRVARVRRDGTFTTPSSIAAVDPGTRGLEVDGLSLGFPLAGPVAAWQVFLDVSEAGDGAKSQTRIDSAGGPLRTLSTPGVQSGVPVVGALEKTTIAAWSERTPGPAGTTTLRLAASPSRGVWEPARTFDDIDGAVAIAAGARSALVAWQPFEPYLQDRGLRLAVYRP